MDVFRVPYKRSFFFYKSVFFIVVYIVAQINAVDYYWHSDPIVAMHSTATLGVPLQVNMIIKCVHNFSQFACIEHKRNIISDV